MDTDFTRELRDRLAAFEAEDYQGKPEVARALALSLRASVDNAYGMIATMVELADTVEATITEPAAVDPDQPEIKAITVRPGHGVTIEVRERGRRPVVVHGVVRHLAEVPRSERTLLPTARQHHKIELDASTVRIDGREAETE